MGASRKDEGAVQQFVRREIIVRGQEKKFEGKITVEQRQVANATEKLGSFFQQGALGRRHRALCPKHPDNPWMEEKGKFYF